jgi:tetratricopeptide (TPR) repeat protein
MNSHECSDASAYCQCGYEKYCRNDYQGAAEEFSKAIGMKPACGSAYNNRGLIRLLLGERIDALADFSMAKKLGHPVDETNLYHSN